MLHFSFHFKLVLYDAKSLMFHCTDSKKEKRKSYDSLEIYRNKTQKRVTALNRELPPRNEQFLLDFGQLQSQFTVSFSLGNVTSLLSFIFCVMTHASSFV